MPKNETPEMVSVPAEEFRAMQARLDRLESERQDPAVARLVGETAALVAELHADPRDARHQHARARIERKYRQLDESAARAKRELLDGPRRFAVKIVDPKGATMNREAFVGAASGPEAEAKYRRYFGIIRTVHDFQTRELSADEAAAVTDPIPPLPAQVERAVRRQREAALA